MIRIKVLMMISGVIKGSNGNDNFYFRLARKLNSMGGGIDFYVYEKPPSSLEKKFNDENSYFHIRRGIENVRLPKSIEILMDAIILTPQLKPDLIVGQYSACGNVAIIVGKIFRIPSIKVVRATSTGHAYQNNVNNISYLHKLKQKILSHFASKIIAVSNAVKDDLQNIFEISNEKIILLRNSISPSDYKPNKSKKLIRSELGIDTKDFVIVVVAAFVKVKGHGVLIDALSSYQGKMPHVLLVGDGPLLEECKNKVNPLEFANNIHFLGRRNDVPNLLWASDMALLPSFSDAFPYFILEAMAAHLPVVATDVDGIPEMVIDTETGFLVPPGNSEKLKYAIEALISNPVMSKTMGEAGHQRLIKFYEISKRINEEIDLYETIINKA